MAEGSRGSSTNSGAGGVGDGGGRYRPVLVIHKIETWSFTSPVPITTTTTSDGGGGGGGGGGGRSSRNTTPTTPTTTTTTTYSYVRNKRT